MADDIQGEEIARHQLTDQRQPLFLAAGLAGSETGEPVMALVGDLLRLLSAQDIDDMRRAEALA